MLLTNKKSHTGFQSVPKSVSVSDLKRPYDHHNAIWQLSEPTASNSLSATKMKIIAHEVEVLEIPGIWFMEIFARVCKIVDVE